MRFRDWKTEYNFHKIQSIMDSLYWSYSDSDTPPTKGRLRDTIEMLLNHLDEFNAKQAKSGGFEVVEEDNHYKIKFVADTQYIEKTEDDIECS